MRTKLSGGTLWRQQGLTLPIYPFPCCRVRIIIRMRIRLKTSGCTEISRSPPSSTRDVRGRPRFAEENSGAIGIIPGTATTIEGIWFEALGEAVSPQLGDGTGSSNDVRLLN